MPASGLFFALACTTDSVVFEEKPELPDSDVLFVDDPLERIEAAPEPADPSDAFFEPMTIHTVDLQMDAAAWAELKSNPWAKNWYAASFSVDGALALNEIGVRAFGAGSMIANKSSLKLSFDHVVPGQKWLGLEQLKLDNSSQDVTYLHERLATEVLRDMNVPAARTTYARLTVNGEAAGLFVVLEAIDDQFTKRWFTTEGPLYGMISGRWGQGLKPMTDPLSFYDVQTAVLGDGSELVAAADALTAGDGAEIERLIDTELFFRESVTRSVMGGYDTFSADGNNYYLYVEDQQVKIIPWDLDYELGAGGLAASLAVDPSAPWLASPWSYSPVTGEDYEDPVLKWNLSAGRDPQQVIDTLLAGPMDWATLDRRVMATAVEIWDDVQVDVLGRTDYFWRYVADLRMFLHQRSSQLAGRDVASCLDAPACGVYLGDLSPTGTVGWGSLMVDSTNWGPGYSVNGQHYCRGVFAHAPSVVEVVVPEGMTVMRGSVGLQDWNQLCGDGARFQVEQDGVLLYESPVMKNYYTPDSLGQIAVSPGPISLIVLAEAEYSCDTASWLDISFACQ